MCCGSGTGGRCCICAGQTLRVHSTEAWHDVMAARQAVAARSDTTLFRPYRPFSVKGKGRYSSSWEPHLRATGRHLPYGITQCYLPPDTSECAPPNPSHAGWYSIYLPRRDGRLSWPRTESRPISGQTAIKTFAYMCYTVKWLLIRSTIGYHNNSSLVPRYLSPSVKIFKRTEMYLAVGSAPIIPCRVRYCLVTSILWNLHWLACSWKSFAPHFPLSSQNVSGVFVFFCQSLHK